MMDKVQNPNNSECFAEMRYAYKILIVKCERRPLGIYRFRGEHRHESNIIF
jgi:hypothetical protein